MADWKTYAKAARNTARRQAKSASRSAQDRPRPDDRYRSRPDDRDRPRRSEEREGPRDLDRDRPRSSERPRTSERPRDDLPRERRPRDDAPRTRSLSAGDYARAARRAVDEGTRESRDSLRRSSARARKDAAAYAAVAERRVRKAQLGRRVAAAFRDALLVGLSLFVIWFVVTRTGVQIPFTAVLAVVGVIVLARFAWALVGQFTARRVADEDDAVPDRDMTPDDGGRDERRERREYDPGRESRGPSSPAPADRRHRDA